jgi:hypothetical protein
MNLIVICLDSFRQDHVSCYHGGQPVFDDVPPCQTPNIDAFAQRSHHLKSSVDGNHFEPLTKKKKRAKMKAHQLFPILVEEGVKDDATRGAPLA